ncbi:OmpA family protein [Alphaproteobacteria bacterium]|nr:OmpA family protein [Alphaproteobacteria bacterium]
MSFASIGCSTVSDTIDLAGIVDKTENFLFGVEEDENDKDVNKEITVNETDAEEETLDIVDIPIEKPEFADIEKDFFDGEKEIIEDSLASNATQDEEPITSQETELTPEQKNINVISRISQNVRMRVRTLLLKSDPPTSNNALKIEYQKENDNSLVYTEEDKIAIFYFPNNSVTPDIQAEKVISDVVKFYGESSLLLIGHASSLGGESPEGKKVNMNISFARAETIKNMLISKGFVADNIKVLGKGDLEPIDKSNSTDKDSNNRRVEVFLVSN